MKTSALEQVQKDFEHGVYNMTDTGNVRVAATAVQIFCQ